MYVDGIHINEDDVIGSENKFLKKHNNIYISTEQINILKKYNFNIDNYKNYCDLIYDIEDYLNNSYEQLDDLEWVSETLSENNYYNNINK